VRRRAFLIVFGVGLILLIGAVVLWLPELIVRRDVLGAKAGTSLDAEHLAAARNSVRTTLLQAVGASFFLATAYFTWAQIRVSRLQLQATEDQQMTNRFTSAIEQLGGSPQAQLGGIYALERLARDSRRDHGPIVEVLAAFVREHARWPGAAQVATADEDARPSQVVQTALTVLGRRTLTHETGDLRVNLSGTDLRGANLRGANLSRALMNSAHLEYADLQGAKLKRTALVGAWLTKAKLRDAHLEGARLINARLEDVRCHATHLQGAQLIGATLDGGRLGETYLARAVVRHASLKGTYLKTAHLDGVLELESSTWDDSTEWPEGFIPPAQVTA
jgi:uncharacterized protein YjbI with pentapeptide repeats